MRQAETIEIASGVLSLGKFFFNRTLIIFLETEIEMSTGQRTGKVSRKKARLSGRPPRPYHLLATGFPEHLPVLFQASPYLTLG